MYDPKVNLCLCFDTHGLVCAVSTLYIYSALAANLDISKTFNSV